HLAARRGQCDTLASMCVIAFAWNVHPRWRLLLIGNRDEAHARPSAPLQRWADAPDLLAGRDLEAGGTWMGVHEPGRACVVTNVRDPRAAQDRASRGWLVTDFLQGADPAAHHAEALQAAAIRYRPFNLLLFDAFTDETPAPDAALPDTGVGIELERKLSPVFVRGERYGTRATTLIALS